MELSLQSKINYKSLHNRRENLIKKEMLHMQDSIDYNEFKRLHERYASDLEEADFAKYFLDINWRCWYKMKTGSSLSTNILSHEYYDYKEFIFIRERIEDEYNFERIFKISGNNLKILYEKYGQQYSFEEFGEKVLGIKPSRVVALKYKTNSKSVMLTQGVYSKEKDFEELRKKIFTEQKELIEQSYILSGWQVEDLHQIYGGRFSLSIFAENVLGIKERVALDAVKNKGTITEAFREEIVNFSTVKEIQERLVNEEKLHIGSQITKEQFERLYEKYKCFGISKEQFGIHILGLSSDSMNHFKNKKSVFMNYPINPWKIENLREKVIALEKLHIGDNITLEKFEELYEKYAGILSREIFAEEILDVSYEALKQLVHKNEKTSILGKIEISKSYIEDLRERIIKENNLEYNQLMNLSDMRKLYEKYESIFPEIFFYVSVLGVSKNSLVFRGTVKEAYILSDYKEDLKAIREAVIFENKLHCFDRINYIKLKKLHQKYAPKTREHIFAKEVLDIDQSVFDRIKLSPKNNAKILLDEPLPSTEEIKRLKDLVINKENLHRKDKIDYKKFRKLYLKYGRIMPEDMFAKEVLDITAKILSRIKLKKNENLKTQILLHTYMDKDQIEELKQALVYENLVYPNIEITLAEFENLYKKYEHILSPAEFAKQVLEMDAADFNSLVNKKEKTRKIFKTSTKDLNRTFSNEEKEKLKEYLNNGKTNREIAKLLWHPLQTVKYNIENLIQEGSVTKESIQRILVQRLYFQGNSKNAIIKETGLGLEEINAIIKDAKDKSKDKKKQQKNEKRSEQQNRVETLSYSKLRLRAIKVLDEYIENKANCQIIQRYIESSARQFISGEFKKSDIDLLGEAIEFLQSGEKEISLFARICVSFNEYEKANRFILGNLDNENVTKEGKRKLLEIRSKVQELLRNQAALKMVNERKKEL